jgi:hypothetical protein
MSRLTQDVYCVFNFRQVFFTKMGQLGGICNLFYDEGVFDLGNFR